LFIASNTRMQTATDTRLTFRRAVSADIPTLMRIRFAVKENRLSDPSRVTAQDVEDYLDQLGRGWVCEEDGQIIGFSFAAREDHSIWALFIDPEHEGKGAGKRLLQLAVDWLFELGATQVQLGTSVGTRAERFYAAQGWQRGGMRNAIEVEFTLAR
jgi:GNAT superfamily N-acetyltransferase